MQKIMYNRQYGLEEAVIEGRKNMTRRIAHDGELENPHVEFHTKNCEPSLWDGKKLIATPKYHIGEIVAVAQSYKDIAGINTWINSERIGISVKYAMTLPGWTNKMFVKAELMPVKQKCTDIKIERLQDISVEDCIKEGVVSIGSLEGPLYVPSKNLPDVFPTARGAFSFLIDKVSGKGTYERNPWVFAYTFELVK